MDRQRIIQIALISAAVIFFLLILIFTIDYVAYRDSRIKNRLALEFCECAMNEKIQGGDYKIQEDFQYPILLDSTYAKTFQKYRGSMSGKEREAFIEDVQRRVFKRCPSAVEQIFR